MARQRPLSETGRNLLAHIPDDWGDCPRYADAIVLRSLINRGLVERSVKGIRKTEAGKAVFHV